MTGSLLQSLAYALRCDCVEVAGAEDLVNDDGVGSRDFGGQRFCQCECLLRVRGVYGKRLPDIAAVLVGRVQSLVAGPYAAELSGKQLGYGSARTA